MTAFLIYLLQLLLIAPVATATHTDDSSSVTRAHVGVTTTRHRAVGHAQASATLHGADISWPNCPKGEGIPSRRSQGEPMPRRSAAFVVVGLTNGPGFYPNPCIAQQLAWVHKHDRRLAGYAMTTYPSQGQIRASALAGPYDGTRPSGMLRNAGYAEATYNVRLMKTLGMKVPMIWVDVEPYPTSPWSSSHHANRAIVRGVIRGYRHAGYPVGIYTYANGWAQVVGPWRLRNIPTWTTAGPAGERSALAMCHRGPSGGVTWLAQWYTTHRDFDATCPAAPKASRLFH